MKKLGGVVPAKIWISILTTVGILMSILTGYIIWASVRNSVNYVPDPVQIEVVTGTPELQTTPVLEGLSHVWDIAFAPDGTTYFTERDGDMSAIVAGSKRVLEHPADVAPRGEGGMMGMTLDSEFASNRYLYACFNTTNDIRLVRWKVRADNSGLDERTDLITGLPTADSGRHSGCRPRFGLDGYLWVGTGDAATGENPQSPTSLGGKILRIDRDGQPAPDNFGIPFDPRIYSYGHRNTQGLAFLARPHAGVIGYSVEHGPDVDDEINELTRGNFGWDPVPGTYNESVPMTDTSKYPNAVPATWSSDRPTLAPSGATILSGSTWKSWNGALAVAMLKSQHVRIFRFDKDQRVTEQVEVLNDLGRTRAITMGPNDDLYIGTSNGSGQDKILRVQAK